MKSKISKRHSFRVTTISALVAVMVIFGVTVNLSSRAAAVSGDLNNDTKIDVFDLSILLANWGKTGISSDINTDGVVNVFDLSILLSNWGKTGTVTSPTPTIVQTPSPTSTAAGCGQAQIQAMVDSVSAATIEANLRKLTQDDTKPAPNQSISRHVSSTYGNKQKTDWMKQQLVSYGLTDASQNFTSGGFSLTNPVGRLTGSTTPNNVYAIGGHIDAQSENAKVLAPGAEDDGSGVVVTMEAARVMASFKSCMKSTVDFIGFNDEEEGEGGSATYVTYAKTKAFKAMLNMDMVAYAPSGECVKTDANLPADTAVTQKVLAANTKYNIGLNISAGRYTVTDIDNSSFWDANLPSTYLVDCATEVDSSKYPNYHSTGDIVSATNINFTQLAKLTKVLVATLAEMSIQ